MMPQIHMLESGSSVVKLFLKIPKIYLDRCLKSIKCYINQVLYNSYLFWIALFLFSLSCLGTNLTTIFKQF